MMQSAVRQQRYKLKKDFFDSVPLHLVRKTSPVKVMSNEQWIELVDSWMTPQKMVFSRKQDSMLVHANLSRFLHVLSFDVGGKSKEQRESR